MFLLSKDPKMVPMMHRLDAPLPPPSALWEPRRVCHTWAPTEELQAAGGGMGSHARARLGDS